MFVLCLYSLVLISFYVFKHVRLLDYCFKCCPVLLCFLRSGLGFLSQHAYAGQSLRMQISTCTHIFLPRNLNLSFLLCFLHLFHMLCLCFDSLYRYKSLFSVYCLFAFLMFKLGFIFCFLILMPWTRIHMFMHECHRCWDATR